MLSHNPIICALDTHDLSHALSLATELAPFVGMLKVGLEFFTMHGRAGVQAIAATGLPVFLDLKFHDIPNTVAGAVTSALQCGASMMTLHLSGGKEMVKAAKEAADTASLQYQMPRPLLLGVTVLTSIDASCLTTLGVQESLSDHVKRLADIAVTTGLDGIVCSPHEITMIRNIFGKKLLLVVPGIRPSLEIQDDQKRTLTPQAALQAGADYLVIGRPITQAAKPALAARHIRDTLAA